MKKMSKKLGMFCGMVLCGMLVFATGDMTVCASEIPVVEDNEGRAANLTWYYKEIDGEMYMRLWNHATQQWVTDWIPAVY